ncbi:hypothetical protein HPB50_013856 [Hyalomma asiaticum]|uniref:Uncharacterized protein n=1 Tax=Hyalomma asiaticum TaxID=266040 RepID=A0ACB7RNF9_HYAAI|nr:hypothetical protein HPB50_013856 [Hyalomma asiaticum]
MSLLIVLSGIGAAVAAALLYRYLNRRYRPPVLLEDPDTKYAVKMVEREEISHDTRRFRFALPSDEHVLGLPTGQHIYLVATISGQLRQAPRLLRLVVKVYFRNVHPKFPEGGKMSQHLESMAIGDTIQVRGPSGLIRYEGRGKFAVKPDKKSPPQSYQASEIGMIAGGTGITPMLQIIRQVFSDPEDKTNCALIFANQTEDDILLRPELEEVLRQNPGRFRLYLTVDRPKDGWTQGVGFVSADMIERNLPPPSDNSVILMCGPPPMINFACKPNLEKLGYNPKRCFAY